LLFLTGTIKLVSSFGTGRLLQKHDPLFQFLSNRTLFICVGLLEVALAVYLVLGRSTARRLGALAWLATSFIAYRVALVVSGAPEPCKCLGTLTDWMPVNQDSVTYWLKVFLAYMFVGSLTLLAGLSLRKIRPPASKEVLAENRFFDAPCVAALIPVFNEARTIDELMRRVLAQKCVKEVFVVDDASTDSTAERIRTWVQDDPRVHYLQHRTNRGKGAAVRTALEHATAPLVIIQDGDLEYDPTDYEKMLALIVSDQADVVYGSRFLGRNNKSNPIFHTLGNRCLTFCSNIATGLWLTDEATCYKMFKREVLAQIELEEDGFGFCPEVTAKISQLQVRVREVAVSYSGRTKAEGKKIRLRHGWNALVCIIKYNWVRGLGSRGFLALKPPQPSLTIR